MPEEDPTKPPLRLNIPKDSSVSYPFSSHMNPSSEKKKPKLAASGRVSKSPREIELDSELFETDEDYEVFDSNTHKESLRRIQSIASIADNRSSDKLDSQNLLVKSKSSDFLINQIGSDESNFRKRGKKFTLKKELIDENIQLPFGDNKKISDELDLFNKTGIMTIKVSLDDSQSESINETNNSTCDAEIRALAEAIINEIAQNTTKDQRGNFSQTQDEEAYLVIIDVTDGDAPENPSLSAADAKLDSTTVKSSMNKNIDVEMNSPLSLADDGVYGNEIQVRNLKFCDELEKDLCIKKNQRDGYRSGLGRTKSKYRFPRHLSESSIYKSEQEQGKFGKFCDLELDEPARELQEMLRSRQSKKTRTGIIRNKKYRSLSDSVVIFKDNEIVKRGNWERDLRKTKNTRTFFPAKFSKKLNTKDKTRSILGKMDPEQRSSRLERPVECFSNEMEMQTKLKPKSCFEKAVKLLDSPQRRNPQAVLDVMLKPLSKQITFVNEIPEYLRYPEYKYSVLPEKKRLDKLSMISRGCYTFRRNYSKLTKHEDRFHFRYCDSVGSDLLLGNRSRLFTRLDNELCSKMFRGSNVYLQEGMGNIVPSLEMDTKGPSLKANRSDHVPPLIENRSAEKSVVPKSSSLNKEGDSSSAKIGFAEERYEMDTTDAKTMLEGVAYPPKVTTDMNERGRAIGSGNMLAEWSAILRDVDAFEMNPDCVDPKADMGDCLLNSKKHNIINVTKDVTPKISDNIVNITNEELAVDVGANSVDSLRMMELVKEMVDLDLKNAEKIFVPTNNANEEVSLESEKPDPSRFKSVVTYSPVTNLYQVHHGDLEAVMNHHAHNIHKASGSYINNPRGDSNGLQGGDSIVVWDDQTKSWEVDFTLIRNQEMGEDSIITTCDEVVDNTNSLPPNIPSSRNQTESEKPTEEKRKKSHKTMKKEKPMKEVDAQEIRKKNSDLYDDVFVEIKKSEEKPETKEEKDFKIEKTPKMAKKAESEGEHYVSNNIVKMSKSSVKNKTAKVKSKVETVKLKLTPTMRPPSVVTEINLNKKCDDDKGHPSSGKKNNSEDRKEKKPENSSKTFYKKFEKYKSPFSDPEYEEKPMRINSDLVSNPNLKKLDSWNKTLVLQEISKPPESVESWVKDETDKMATLLLKVLQEAADGNSKKRTSLKVQEMKNPYEAIRKKQEIGLLKGKTANRKDSGKRTTLKTQQSRFPVIEDELYAEVITPEFHLPKNVPVQKGLSSTDSDDVPGPQFLKKLSTLWKFIPNISCHATVFSIMWVHRMVQVGSSVLTQVSKYRNDAFGWLFTRYGPIVKLQGPLSGDIVLINRPEDVATVFARQGTTPRSVLDSVEKCRSRVNQNNFPAGITTTSCGPDWDLVRKSTVDVNNKGCLQYFNFLKNADAMFVANLHIKRNKQNQVSDDFMSDVTRWAMEGLCSILFDRSLGFFDKKSGQYSLTSESERLFRHLADATGYLCQCESSFQAWRFFDTPALRGLREAYRSLDLIISKYVYQAEITLRKKRKAVIHKKAGNIHLTFLESLLLNDRLAPEEITANLIDILLIGANATSVAFSFLLYNLSQNFRVQRQLFKEIKELLPNKDSQLNYHRIHSMKYLQACLKESLRLNIPVPVVLRVLPSDLAVASYRIPHGTHLVINSQTACMKEPVFEEPEKFKPERWLDHDCAHPFSIPFCDGPRADFVKRFSEIQLWTCIAKVVRNYQIEYHFGEIKGTRNFISYPDKPLKLTFIERDE